MQLKQGRQLTSYVQAHAAVIHTNPDHLVLEKSQIRRVQNKEFSLVHGAHAGFLAA